MYVSSFALILISSSDEGHLDALRFNWSTVNSREPVSVISARDMSLIGLRRVKRALDARQRHRISMVWCMDIFDRCYTEQP